jgi:sugar phosphate isomerase/epimerase
MFPPRLGCSSINFRPEPLPEALRTLRELGFGELDPDALDHERVRAPGDDIRTAAEEPARAREGATAVGVELWCETLHFFRLCWDEDRAQRLTDALEGTGMGVVMDFSHTVACGGDSGRFVDTCADRIARVHLRDATAGSIDLSLGNGDADFAVGLQGRERGGYTGSFSPEFKTRDVTSEQRPAATRAAAEDISSLL